MKSIVPLAAFLTVISLWALISLVRDKSWGTHLIDPPRQGEPEWPLRIKIWIGLFAASSIVFSWLTLWSYWRELEF